MLESRQLAFQFLGITYCDGSLWMTVECYPLELKPPPGFPVLCFAHHHGILSWRPVSPSSSTSCLPTVLPRAMTGLPSNCALGMNQAGAARVNKILSSPP
jgi:hypothetical protein